MLLISSDNYVQCSALTDAAQAELDREPSQRREPEQPAAAADGKKPGPRTIGAWRKAALDALGKDATNEEIAGKVNRLALDAGRSDYTTTAEEIAAWRT